MKATIARHPIPRARLLFLREITSLEIIRAQYQEQGMVDEALQMERALDYLRESARILADLAVAGGDNERNRDG